MSTLDQLFLSAIDKTIWAYAFLREWYVAVGGGYGSDMQIASLATGFIFCWLLWTTGQLLQWSPYRVTTS